MDATIRVALIAAVASLLVAFLTAVASLLVALVTNITTRSTQREVEELKAKLLERQSERNALRDYEYDARKRLYKECAPLIFQLIQQAEETVDRIGNLSQAALHGNLDPPGSWLSRKYYGLSTLYRFFAPLATLKLLQRQLTLVDLSLDPYLYCQYSLVRQIYRSFSDDFKLASNGSLKLAYDPHHPEAESMRRTCPEVYWQQGVPSGILDNAVQCLVVKEQGEPWRVMTFAQFENQHEQKRSALRLAFDRIRYLFDDFHPRTRPVLWRMLIVQAHLYRAILNIQSGERFTPNLSELAAFPTSERKRFDWRKPGEQIDDSVIAEPFAGAEIYLRQPLANVTEKLGSPGKSS